MLVIIMAELQRYFDALPFTTAVLPWNCSYNVAELKIANGNGWLFVIPTTTGFMYLTLGDLMPPTESRGNDGSSMIETFKLFC